MCTFSHPFRAVPATESIQTAFGRYAVCADCFDSLDAGGYIASSHRIEPVRDCSCSRGGSPATCECREHPRCECEHIVHFSDDDRSTLHGFVDDIARQLTGGAQ